MEEPFEQPEVPVDFEAAEKQPKRAPARECFLNEIKGNETRVAIIVSVVSVNRASKNAIVSDGTAEAVLVFDDSAKMKGLQHGKILRVFAKPSAMNPITLNVELAQELKDFDANLFRRVKELWAKLRE